MHGAERYAEFRPVDLADRTWPSRRLRTAPRWLSTDLRDGNQSLARPMSPERKLMMFELLVGMGYKEIEVGFPVASQDDHDFVRLLIERDLIPDDVRITVLTQAREELIRATLDALRGAPRAMVHIYNATSPLFRRLVFGIGRDGCRDLAVHATRVMVEHAERTLGDCDLGYQYSPELFNETELDFSLEVCEAVMDVWQPEAGRGIILNFPTTVERSLPNVFADQIEWLDRNLSRREHVCLSIHPHNDRGTGVASAELALLAGAERVEGCLFGNGERAGNVCLVTLGMNLYVQGVDPGIDFSDLNAVRDTVEQCNQLPVHPRHPYGGDLVYTAFSGSHQDAIKKGFDERERVAAATGTPAGELPWRMPYLPVDPRDVGRTYEAVVRINSQSGKGGVAYVMSARHGLNLPRGLQADLAARVQARADAEGGELSPERIGALFRERYLYRGDPSRPLPVGAEPVRAALHVDCGFVLDDEQAAAVRGLGALLAPWGIQVRAVYSTAPPLGDAEPEPGRRAPGEIVVYAECDTGAGRSTEWGAGIGADVAVCAFSAVRAAIERARACPAPTGVLADTPADAPADARAEPRRRLAAAG
ncbi:2-isopropylmalate synthase [Nonomuraea coxensis DSM 45129]|uniref:2-isopropylmalate synthase n=1 Tax=Nonomuraea coxensis DSM 45129 TaxID=1122611 RepID=A0ABX8U4U5_9ACTN|nr:2-isopropylmalate synthase [Nonomuraea coxensis]QYC42730.1 2-isopropylmalate synthase [Nonomuraea coxensis DSM 45129]